MSVGLTRLTTLSWFCCVKRRESRMKAEAFLTLEVRTLPGTRTKKIGNGTVLEWNIELECRQY